MMRTTWVEVTELSPKQIRARKVLVALTISFGFLAVLGGIALLGLVTQ